MSTTVTLEFTGPQIIEALRKNGHDIPEGVDATYYVHGSGRLDPDLVLAADNPLRVTFERPAVPVLELRQLPTVEVHTHGGRKNRRRFKILVNGVEMETLSEGSERLHYAEDRNFEHCMRLTVERYEAALRTEATRTEGRS